MSEEIIRRACGHWHAARWWTEHAKESAIPGECLEASANLQRLAVHMLQNPNNYFSRKNTDWEEYRKAILKTAAAHPSGSAQGREKSEP